MVLIHLNILLVKRMHMSFSFAVCQNTSLWEYLQSIISASQETSKWNVNLLEVVPSVIHGYYLQNSM